jgi:hypothetical protein
VKVYAVKYSNYEPAEVDSLFLHRADAEAHAERLNERSDTDAWEVVEWVVRASLDSKLDTAEPDGDAQGSE